MRSITVTWDDGDTTQTMINGTEDEIRRYYVGQPFNVGYFDQDRIKTAVSVEFHS